MLAYTEPFEMRDTSNTNKVQFRVFKGRLYLSVFPTKERGVLFNTNIPHDCRQLIISELRAMDKANPGTRKPLIKQKWNNDERKFENDLVIIFIKDENGVNLIELQTKQLATPVKCALSCQKGIQSGTEQMSPREGSSLRLKTLLEWLTASAPLMMTMTAEVFDPSKMGNRNNGSPSVSKSDGKGASSEEFSY